MKKVLKVLFWIVAIAAKILLFIGAVNLLFSYISEKKRGSLPENGTFYDWKFGKIYYHKRGQGAPVLLIHGLEPADSSKDLESLSKYLSNNHTVYLIDLLGFGFSDKPWITYTNYLYVQLIQDFIRDICGQITDVVACKGSAFMALLANQFDDSRLGNVVLVEPCRQESVNASKPFAIRMKKVLDFPLFGTFLYNIYSLTGAAPFDKDGRHVFASRLTGHLTTDIGKRPEIMTTDIRVFGDPAKEPSDFTFEDIEKALA